MWKDDFKWVVKRNVAAVPRPKLLDYTLTLDSSKNVGFSITRGKVAFSYEKPIGGMFSKHWMADLYKMKGGDPTGMSVDSLFGYWDFISPGLILKQDWNMYHDTWTLTKPEYLLDYSLLEKSGNLYFVPGPLVKTKFVPASLDTPVCNFGRLPPPPPINNPAWVDTLLVAVHDSAVIDGFYFHFPWAKRWGKAIIDTKIRRSGAQVALNVSHVFAEVGDTKPFVFFSGRDDVYSERRKCLDKVEAMWAGEYNTLFIGEL